MCVLLVCCTGESWGQSGNWHLGVLVTSEVVFSRANAGDKQEQACRANPWLLQIWHPPCTHFKDNLLCLSSRPAGPTHPCMAQLLSGCEPSWAAPKGDASTVWIICVLSFAVFPSPATSPQMKVSALATPYIWFQDFFFPPLQLLRLKTFSIDMKSNQST